MGWIYVNTVTIHMVLKLRCISLKDRKKTAHLPNTKPTDVKLRITLPHNHFNIPTQHILEIKVCTSL